MESPGLPMAFLIDRHGETDRTRIEAQLQSLVSSHLSVVRPTWFNLLIRRYQERCRGPQLCAFRSPFEIVMGR